MKTIELFAPHHDHLSRLTIPRQRTGGDDHSVRARIDAAVWCAGHVDDDARSHMSRTIEVRIAGNGNLQRTVDVSVQAEVTDDGGLGQPWISCSRTLWLRTSSTRYAP